MSKGSIALLMSVHFLSACATSQKASSDVEGSVHSEIGMTPLGSDLSPLARLHPQGTWLRLDAPLLSQRLVVNVEVNGIRFPAILDSGASITMIPRELAERLSLTERSGTRSALLDSQGTEVPVLALTEPLTLVVGDRSLQSTRAHVSLNESPQDRVAMPLIGADVLSQVDLLVDPQSGWVGLFPAGHGPRALEGHGTQRLALYRNDSQLRVVAKARGIRGTLRFEMVVDTGAVVSTIPNRLAHNEVPLDLNYNDTLYSIAKTQRSLGRFALDKLWLGEKNLEVRHKLVTGSASDFGLMGNDILLRQPMMLSFQRREIVLFEPTHQAPKRMRGPGNERCEGAPCVEVALEQYAGGLCLNIDIDNVYAGRTAELAVTFHPPSGLQSQKQALALGTVHAYVTVGKSGAHVCSPLWKELIQMGLTKETEISLRGMRVEGLRWPCDPMASQCLTYSGPMAQRARVP